VENSYGFLDTEGEENLWDWQIAFCCFIFILGVVDLSEGWRESI
jgi:hypothetical protein